MNITQSFGREMGHGGRGFEGRERGARPEGFNRDFEFRERLPLPDSLRGTTMDGRNFRAMPDSVHQNRRESEFPRDRGTFSPDNDRFRRSDFHGGRRISLANVAWFFTVYALFPLITLVVDKGLQYFSRKNK